MTNVLVNSVFAGGNTGGGFRGIKWRDTGFPTSGADIILPFCENGKRYLLCTKAEFPKGTAYSVGVYNIDTEEISSITLRENSSSKKTARTYAYGQVGDKMLFSSYIADDDKSIYTDYVSCLIDSDLNVTMITPDFVPTKTVYPYFTSMPAGNILFMESKIDGATNYTNRFTLDGVRSAVTTTLPEIYFKGKLYYHTTSGNITNIYQMDFSVDSSGVPSKTDNLITQVSTSGVTHLYSFRNKVFLTQSDKFFIFSEDFSTPQIYPLDGTNLSWVYPSKHYYSDRKIPVCADRNSTMPLCVDINTGSSTDYGIQILMENCSEIMFYASLSKQSTQTVYAYGFDECIFLVIWNGTNLVNCYRIEQA